MNFTSFSTDQLNTLYTTIKQDNTDLKPSDFNNRVVAITFKTIDTNRYFTINKLVNPNNNRIHFEMEVEDINDSYDIISPTFELLIEALNEELKSEN